MIDPYDWWLGQCAALAGQPFCKDASSEWKDGFDYAVRTSPVAYAKVRLAEKLSPPEARVEIYPRGRGTDGAPEGVGIVGRLAYHRALAGGLSEDEADVAAYLADCPGSFILEVAGRLISNRSG